MITKFEDVIAWQKGRSLVIQIYKSFKNNRDYDFKDQIQRAAVSIINNIAEGFERKGNKEFIRFLYLSKGSCAEVRSMLYLSLDLEYINLEIYNLLKEQTEEISKLLASLIRSQKNYQL